METHPPFRSERDQSSPHTSRPKTEASRLELQSVTVIVCNEHYPRLMHVSCTMHDSSSGDYDTVDATFVLSLLESVLFLGKVAKVDGQG